MAYTGSKAQAARGSVVSIGGVTGAGGSETFTAISEITKAPFSGSQWSTGDVTNFNSNVDEEFVSLTRNNGEVTLEGNLIDGDPGQTALFAAYDSGFKYDFKVQLPPAQGETTGRLYTFSALVETGGDVNLETKSVVTFSSKLKISGPVTRTPGS